MSWCGLLRALKGGSGSGNFGHSGRPGKIGGSSEGGIFADRGQTVDVKLHGVGTIAVDKGIASLLKAMDKVGIQTYHSCAGHTCDLPLESQLSFREPHVKRESIDAYNALVDIVNSGKLEHQWEIVTHPVDMNHKELRVTGGFYGKGVLPSTDINVKLARQDLQTMTKLIDSIHAKYKD